MIPSEFKKLVDDKIKSAIVEVTEKFNKEIEILKAQVDAQKTEIKILKEGVNI